MCSLIEPFPTEELYAFSEEVQVCSASNVDQSSSIWITDPPYADAIRYEEITLLS
jgi:hypothetical protein